MARTDGKKKLLGVATDAILLYFAVSGFCIYINAERIGVDIDTGDGGPGCHSTFYPCYNDCCDRGGDWFCNHEQQRCTPCATKKTLCGNESLPLECRLYCYKIAHPQDECQEDPDTVVSLPTFIVSVSTLGVIVVSLCLFARRLLLDKWRACCCVLWGETSNRCYSLTHQEEGKADVETPMIPKPIQTKKDISTQTGLQSDSPETSSSSPSPLSSTPSGPSSPTSDDHAEDSNLTSLLGDNGSGNEARGARANHDGAPPASSTRGSQVSGPAGNNGRDLNGRNANLPRDDGNTQGPPGGQGRPLPPKTSESSAGRSRVSQEGSNWAANSTTVPETPAGIHGGSPRMTSTVAEEGKPVLHGPVADTDVNLRARQPQLSMISCPSRPDADDKQLHVIAMGGTNPLPSYLYGHTSYQ